MNPKPTPKPKHRVEVKRTSLRYFIDPVYTIYVFHPAGRMAHTAKNGKIRHYTRRRGATVRAKKLADALNLPFVKENPNE